MSAIIEITVAVAERSYDVTLEALRQGLGIGSAEQEESVVTAIACLSLGHELLLRELKSEGDSMGARRD